MTERTGYLEQRLRRWNVWELERLARDHAGADAELDEERIFLVRHLRDFADAAGLLPPEFDGLVQESFGELADLPAAATAEPEPVEAPAATATAAASPAAPRKRLDLAKKILVLAMLAGLIAMVAGGSTFASFSAQTANPGGAFSSGTLTLSDQVNSGTACNSYGGASKDNYNAACDAILALANAAPGVTGGQAKLTITNTGSLDASLFSVFAPYAGGVLGTAIGSGATIGTGQSVTSFSVSSLEGPISTGDKIVLSYGTVTQQFCAGGNVSPSSATTTIPISGGYPAGSSGSCAGTPPTTTAATAFAVGTRLEDTSSDTSAANTDCYDQKTTTAGVAGATKGTDLNFNATTGNPFCSAALLWIQEQSTAGASTYAYCWFGRGSPYGDQGGNTEDTNGQCRTPTTLTLSGTYSSGQASYTLTVAPLTGNIRSGDTVTLSEGGTTTTCTNAASTYYIGATSVQLGGCTTSGGATTFDSSATVKDKSAFTALDGSNPSSTISSFDTAHSPAAPITLAPLTGNGTANTGASVQLSKHGTTGDTRVFYVGVYFPGGASTNQNFLQGLLSTFGLTWSVDQ
ncbi:MAG TPA: hypothetical protein VE088_00435 [Gaiellaceae bacterium]|nr:hypothetical protein [Gaiellaceae bacterium]